MKLSNLIENNAVAVGSNILKKSIGGDKSGQMTARALDQVAQGGAVNRQFIDALQPYANILNKILSNPTLRQRFEQMIKQLGDEIPAESVSEAMSDAYGIADVKPEVEGSVEFKQHKNTDKGSVSIEASGDDMQELAKVLKLAGLTLPKGMNPEEPEVEEICSDCGKPASECDCPGHDHSEEPVQIEVPYDDECCDDCSDDDVAYSTDKEVLTNYIKDKLAKSLS
jgi:hypothetical protein